MRAAQTNTDQVVLYILVILYFLPRKRLCVGKSRKCAQCFPNYPSKSSYACVAAGFLALFGRWLQPLLGKSDEC